MEKIVKAEPVEEEGRVNKCAKDVSGGSAAAVQPVLLHHGLPADRYALVLPSKLSPTPAAFTISIDADGIRVKNNAMGSTVRMGPCGGGGGAARDMDMRGVNRVVRVIVRHGLAIDAVSVLYERNGREEWTDLWGGQGGTRSEIRLHPDEYLTSVKGHVSKYDGIFLVRSLTFVGNLRSFGPFGVEDGVPFTLPAAGGKIVGFHARSGILLDALGTYVKMD